MMDQKAIYHALKEDFEATFTKELIPGILHNFANPLNGIMGRSKLLQRRIEDTIKKIENLYPDAAEGMAADFQKISSDIRAVNQESDFFFKMFRDVSGKFYSLASREKDSVNLSKLLDAEMRFANFYLDFKHEIKKDSQFRDELPELSVNLADFSMAFWRLIRFAMSRALASQEKELYISTNNDEKNVNVLIKYSGDKISKEKVKQIIDKIQSCSCDKSADEVDSGAYIPLLLFSKYQAKIEINHDNDLNAISVSFPYRSH